MTTWRRLGPRRAFRYVDQRGEPILDERRLARIESLRIPPAWRDVRIASRPSAKVQATGLDAAGRRQYVYDPRYRAAREQAKFDRLVRFGELLPAFRATAARHVGTGPYACEWACAVAATLVDRGWFRVGSERYARRSRTYGITTLRKRHVSVEDGEVRIAFRGKHRVMVRSTVDELPLVDAIEALLALDGSTRLFRCLRDGIPEDVTARQLNRYLAEHLGLGFTAKDFRTWGGTLTAAVALAEHGPAGSPGDLGNTAAVARSSYVSPAVVEQWREGRTIAGFRNASTAARSRRRGRGWLTADEAALLSLLRSWRVRRARAA